MSNRFYSSAMVEATISTGELLKIATCSSPLGKVSLNESTAYLVTNTPFVN
jgi:hypothetical protein